MLLLRLQRFTSHPHKFIISFIASLKSLAECFTHFPWYLSVWQSRFPSSWETSATWKFSIIFGEPITAKPANVLCTPRCALLYHCSAKRFLQETLRMAEYATLVPINVPFFCAGSQLLAWKQSSVVGSWQANATVSLSSSREVTFKMHIKLL